MYEAFADRNYNDDLTLVSRTENKAVISNSNELISHVSRILFQGKVKSITGKELPIKADTICIHGDNPNAVKLLKDLRTHINNKV